MLSSGEFERTQRQNVEDRRASFKRWAEYVRTHDDEVWSRQQNKLIDSQIRSANELARKGDTDPVKFFIKRDRLQRDTE